MSPSTPGQRMFVAIVPPPDVVDALTEFLEPRTGMPWIVPEQWHLTLAFMADVPEHRIDDLAAGLGSRLARQPAVDLRLGGAGCFPSPERARVLWLGVDPAGGEHLGRLSKDARQVANAVGAAPDGTAFVPHVTLARLRRPLEATKWLRILDTFVWGAWSVQEVELIASHLGEGQRRRPRHETIATFPLADPQA